MSVKLAGVCCGPQPGATARYAAGAVAERDADALNLCWTLLPGLDLVAMRAFGVVAVFYVLADEETVRRSEPEAAQRWRSRTGLAFTFGEG